MSAPQSTDCGVSSSSACMNVCVCDDGTISKFAVVVVVIETFVFPSRLYHSIHVSYRPAHCVCAVSVELELSRRAVEPFSSPFPRNSKLQTKNEELNRVACGVGVDVGVGGVPKPRSLNLNPNVPAILDPRAP
jgi:hypothetical protein